MKLAGHQLSPGICRSEPAVRFSPRRTGRGGRVGAISVVTGVDVVPLFVVGIPDIVASVDLGLPALRFGLAGVRPERVVSRTAIVGADGNLFVEVPIPVGVVGFNDAIVPRCCHHDILSWSGSEGHRPTLNS